MPLLALKFSLLVAAAQSALMAQAPPLEPGAPLPPVSGLTIKGETYQATSDHPESGGGLQLLLFFRPGAGDELANKLRSLHEHYGESVVRCAAIGMNEAPSELRAYAERMGMSYPVISSDELAPDAQWCASLPVLPVTVIASTGRSPLVLRVLTGSGTTKIALLTEVAEQLFQQLREEAIRVAELALGAGEPETRAREIRAYSRAAAGDIEAAKQEFQAMDSPLGQAKLEFAEGNLPGAERLLRDNPDPEARAVLAEIYFMQGRDEKASALLSKLDVSVLPGAQAAQVEKLRGDMAHRQGDSESAVLHYETAIRTSPVNPGLLIEAGLALSDLATGEALLAAESVLQRAARIGDDPLAEGLLKRVASARSKAADSARAVQVREQINALKARYEEERSKGPALDARAWTTPPLHFAVLNEHSKSFAFPRAGYDVLVQQEMETLIRDTCGITVLERSALQPLLVSDGSATPSLLKPEHQPVLGRVAGVSHIAFLNYTLASSERRVHLRVLDVTTTEVSFHGSVEIDLKNPLGGLPTLVQKLTQAIKEDFPLRGIALETQPDGSIRINLGRSHGLAHAEVLTAYEPEAAERTGVAPPLGELRPIARLQVEQLSDTESICKLTTLRDGHTLSAGAWVARDASKVAK